MAVTTFADSPVESVKRAVRSTSTCSNATVLTLQSLLRGSTASMESNVGRKNAKETTAATGDTAGRSQKTRGTRTNKENATSNVLGRSDRAQLSTQEKLVLATELFNATLKTLSDELKAPSKPHVTTSEDDRSRTPRSPLRRTSPNRLASSARNTKTAKARQTPTDDADNGLVAVAESARLALSSLRMLKSDQEQENGLPNVQLEQGACVLVGRLIGLGLNDMAYRDLKGLKRRIRQYLDNQGSGKKTARSKTKEMQEDDLKERHHDLLTFPNVTNARPLLGLLVSFQANALRLIAAEKRPSTVQKLCPSLQLSDPSNPAKVILAAVESGSLTKDKAAIQLQVLSSTVSSLCAGPRRSSDERILDTRDQLKPITTLILQLLSLEIKCMGWKLSGHMCDETKEMWDPLARYVGGFAHHNKGLERTEFLAVYKTVLRLRSAVADTQKTSPVTDSTSAARITTILGQIAQDAGCYDEAMKLLTEAITPLSAGQSLALGTVRCKLAFTYFQSPKPLGKSRGGLAKAVLEATTALGLPLKGSANDLDELLVEAAKLKKTAMAWLGDWVSKGSAVDSDESETYTQVREYLASFVKFLRRYIGRQPSDEHDPKEHEVFQTRVNNSRSIVVAAVESAVAIGKVSVTSQRPPWEEMLSILADCQRLLTTVEAASQDVSDTFAAENVGLAFVKMSNLFWSRYVKEREADKSYRDLILLLRQSTSLLSSCSQKLRDMGFAAIKYERLAHVYTDGNMVLESEMAFCQAIKEHIDTGVLEKVLSESPGMFPHRASRDPKDTGFMLGRVLSAFLKMKLRRGEADQIFYDSEELNQDSRGLILEWQLGLLAELRSYANRDSQFRGTMSLLVLTLFTVYSVKDHPIRRMRVMLFAIRYSLEHPSTFDSIVLPRLTAEGLVGVNYTRSLGQDAKLVPFGKHINACLRLTIGLHEGTLKTEELDRTVSDWTATASDCRDKSSLASQVVDVEYWLLQIKAVVDYTEIHGLWKLQLSALQLLLHVSEIQKSDDASEPLIILSRLVLQYSRLGQCRAAGGLYTRAQQYLDNHEVSPLATLSFNLAQVEYLLEIGEAVKAADVLFTAQTLYEKSQRKQEWSGMPVLTKIDWERLVADAAHIHSRVSFAQGSTTQALFFAKLAVKLNCRIWAKIEKISQKAQGRALQASGAVDMDSLTEGVARLDVSQTSAPDSSMNYTQGAPFWPHIGSHHTALLNLSSLSAHHGLFQDAVYYGEQALKINKSLNANIRLVASQAHLGSFLVLGGHVSDGQEFLTEAGEMSEYLEGSLELASLHMSFASLHKSQGRHEDELRALLGADSVVSSFIEAENVDKGTAELENQMAQLQVRGTGRRAPQRTTGRRTRAATTSKRSDRKDTSSLDSGSDNPGSRSLLRLRGEILRQQADCSYGLGDYAKATQFLLEARKFAVSQDSQISLHIGESEHLLANAIRRFATHAVYCVLPESTISLPALQSPQKAANVESVPAKPSTTRRQRAPAKSTRAKAPRTSEDFSIMLSKAGECLNTIFDSTTMLGSTLDNHAASRLMSRISMLTHTTAPSCSAAWPHSPANVNEIGRIGAFTRERKAIDLDKQLARSFDPLVWPTATSTVELDHTLYSDFTKEYIDILPDNWNVLSLSLSADRTEFVVSRLRYGHSPFLLRLPLKRGNSEDEEEQFTFEDGRNELEDIVELTNESAHSARSQIDKKSKKEWWRNREALDQRLGNLLQNIENIWFGGFRGVFSPVPVQNTPLSRFASAFETVLDNHLPSRRGRASGPKLTLHQNVLELFVGIQGLEEQEDPEDTLMDLLYFVVDILQFQGERNAYDEIDFDMMVVETLDALRSYHKAVQDEPSEGRPNHTILVLDKSLHSFPWESLPCLQGSPVCRVPSLECLRDRVLQVRKTTDKVYPGQKIDRRDGSYILNPAGDLQQTQGAFDKELSGLDWTGIVHRVPSEEEFRDNLEKRSIFLYFGHGSGAQYIRGRTIKRLSRCAVSFLMGCSSGTLTEAGEYEPYGTPMNYLHAGSPALVATLWDVTDKDIDRFARSAFEKWGLLEKPDERPVALDTAVGEARSACVLRYLNGAAPVVYGVPGVFLSD